MYTFNQIKEYPIWAELDFRLSPPICETWFNHHIKMMLGYIMPDKCGCGVNTRTSDGTIELTREDIKRAGKILAAKGVPKIMAFLFSSIESWDLRVEQVFINQRWFDKIGNSIDEDNQKFKFWGAPIIIEENIDENSAVVLGIPCKQYNAPYPTIGRITF